METKKGILPICPSRPQPFLSGGSGWKELGYDQEKPQPASPCPISHGHFRKHSEVLGGCRGEGPGTAIPWVSTGCRAALTGKGVERPGGGWWKISSLTRGRFKFSPCERRHLGSTLMERVEGQLGPQQCVAPDTQLGHACPWSLPRRGTQTRSWMDTPWRAGVCSLQQLFC